ncbi:hypothetical protein N7507_007984 [Penicillium longicatenatum]|nr:hypothetical protein N7507_007984 [Penicillium longicatenatum]
MRGESIFLPGVSHCRGTAGLLQIRQQQGWGSSSGLDRVARRPINNPLTCLLRCDHAYSEGFQPLIGSKKMQKELSLMIQWLCLMIFTLGSLFYGQNAYNFATNATARSYLSFKS